MQTFMYPQWDGAGNQKKTDGVQPSDCNDSLAGIIHNLEYAAYNLLDGKKYTDLPPGIMESTGASESLLIAIRDLKRIANGGT